MALKSKPHSGGADESTVSAHIDPRHLARELALQFLYQLESQKGQNLEMIDEFLREFGTDCGSQLALAKNLTLQTWQHVEEIDQQISQVSSNWQLSRISLVDHSNLRLALCQLLYFPDIPPRVAINEAIELAKTFSTAQAPGFVNGILDHIYHHLNSPKPPEELPTE